MVLRKSQMIPTDPIVDPAPTQTEAASVELVTDGLPNKLVRKASISNDRVIKQQTHGCQIPRGRVSAIDGSPPTVGKSMQGHHHRYRDLLHLSSENWLDFPTSVQVAVPLISYFQKKHSRQLRSMWICRLRDRQVVQRTCASCRAALHNLDFFLERGGETWTAIHIVRCNLMIDRHHPAM